MKYIEKIRYIFDIVKSFHIRHGDDQKHLNDLTLIGYVLENDVCYLNYKCSKYNTIKFTFFGDDDIWYDLISDEDLEGLLSKINALYRKKKIGKILKNYEIDQSNI